MSHPATSRYRTLPLSPVAPCDSKSQLSAPKNRFLRSLLGGRADGSGFSKPDINAPFGMRRLAPPPTPHLARNVEIAIISKPTPGACPHGFADSRIDDVGEFVRIVGDTATRQQRSVKHRPSRRNQTRGNRDTKNRRTKQPDAVKKPLWRNAGKAMQRILHHKSREQKNQNCPIRRCSLWYNTRRKKGTPS